MILETVRLLPLSCVEHNLFLSFFACPKKNPEIHRDLRQKRHPKTIYNPFSVPHLRDWFGCGTVISASGFLLPCSCIERVFISFFAIQKIIRLVPVLLGCSCKEELQIISS